MSQINPDQLKQLIEASLFVLAKPMTIKALKETVLSNFNVSRAKIKACIDELQLDYENRGVQLVKVAGGYRFQTLAELSPFLQPLWQEKAPKYSRALVHKQLCPTWTESSPHMVSQKLSRQMAARHSMAQNHMNSRNI